MASTEQHVGSDFQGRRPLVSYAVEQRGDSFVGEDILPPMRGQVPHVNFEAGRLHAAEVSDELCTWGPFTYDYLENGSIRLLEYEAVASEVVIPAEIDGAAVTSIANCAFMNHEEIETVLMPDSIEFLGHNVFSNCVNLRAVRISSALESIGATSFSGCASLEEVTLCSPLVRVGNDDFSDSPVKRLRLGPKVREVEEKPLKLPALREVLVDEANESFVSDGVALYSKDRAVFYRLIVPHESFAVSASCVEVADRAFDSLDSLKAVELPEGVRHIGRLAFAKTGLSTVRIPRSVESIGEKAFFHCKKLTTVSFATGLVSLSDEVFAHSSVAQLTLPSTLEHVGYQVFEQTPAQKRIAEGSIAIDANNAFLDLDECGGLYKHDAFVEFIGCGAEYTIRRGTRTVGEGAFRRHRSIKAVVVPEGVYAIGNEAFRGAMSLARVDLPESLERIGDRAFAGTAIWSLRISRMVREIGFNALLVQGENQLLPHRPLQAIDLDPENPVFYLRNGMLCQRGGNKQDGGDSVLLYVGPDNVVRIPEQVTQIGNLAFCGTDGVDELYLHGHLQSVCVGAFNTARSVPLVHLELPLQLGEGESIDLRIPKLTTRFRQMNDLFFADQGCTWFSFAFYDSWVVHATEIEEFAPAAYARIANPVCLSDHARELYEGVFNRRAPRVCRYFANKGNIEALENLIAWDLLSTKVVEQELEAASHEGRAQAVACLLELRRRKSLDSALDFSL